MGERIKSFNKFLKNGGLFRCDLFTQLIRQHPEQILKSMNLLDTKVNLKDRQLCNCFATTQLECDCSRMPLLHHFVYVISSFGHEFDLAKKIIDALICAGCEPNEIDSDIGTVLHAIILGIDTDIKANASPSEYEISFKCLDYLLDTNKCHLDIDVGRSRHSQAFCTPLGLAVEKKLIPIVEKLISAGANVKYVRLDECQLPYIMAEQDVKLFDMLYLAGYDKFPKKFRLLLHEHILIEHRFGLNNPPAVKYNDWIKKFHTNPLSLKNLARIVVREALSNKINDKLLIDKLKIPPALIKFIKFTTTQPNQITNFY